MIMPSRGEHGNPCGLRGLSFVVVASPDPAGLERVLVAFGFANTMRHHGGGIALYQQGAIAILVDRSSRGSSARLAAAHGPTVSALGWRVTSPATAAAIAAARGATLVDGDLVRRDGAPVEAIEGIGGSLIYLVGDGDDWASLGFAPVPQVDVVSSKGFVAIDHLTNNVPRGELDHWTSFYRDVFGFTDVRYFDIRGARTGLHSFALRSPCGTFCIPINEGTGTGSQIDEFLEEHRGPGIQHLAFLTDDIVASLRALEGSPIQFLDIEKDYYRNVFDRVPNVVEDHAELARRAILIDGDDQGYLLQIFTRNLIGPAFIELIQRRNHASFGEGNFGALFRSIERDQVRRGYLR